METPEYIEKLRIVGGDVALDFVNTEDGDPPVECLRGYGDLVAWGVLVGLLSAEEGERLMGEADLRPGDAEAAYRNALTLRRALYDVFRAVAEDEAPASRDLKILREYAATGLLTSGNLDRLKLCAGCYWIFLDASRNRSRRWCTMEVCGTDEKKRRYVAKRAARREAGRRGA